MNRLGDESSPYLRQHAANPVDWYPWCDEAFERARSESKPVFLSVGYSSCHWCHVMARESFEDVRTADLLNRLFVCVKVDREERPDIDAVYMKVVQTTTGRGGWPMSVWLTPDALPIYGGTYFPDEDRHGMPAFTRVCREVARVWDEDPEDVVDRAEQLTAALAEPLALTGDGPPAHEIVAKAPSALYALFDAEWGGFGSAPKFPPAATVSFLCRSYVRTGSPETLRMIRTTLDAMAAGGIHDHLGGGFARYSTDRFWLVPHFEKMLYDNALLARAYLHGWMVTGESRYRRVVEDTVGYVLRELALPDDAGSATGVFCAAQDADSEGEEGRFYLWDLPEIAEVCGDDADEVIRYFGATPSGNLEGRNVLSTTGHFDDVPPAVSRCVPRLLARRNLRTPPALDDKILLAWNALFVRSLAEAAVAFARDDWLVLARKGAHFMLAEMRRDDGRLMHSWHTRNEDEPHVHRARQPAFAEDYAALLEALVTLVEVDDASWLPDARSVADDLLRLFHDSEAGGFFATGIDADPLIVRPRDLEDGATPAATSMAANGLLRLASLTGDGTYAAPAVEALPLPARRVAAHPGAFAYLLESYERCAGPLLEVVIIGEPSDPRFTALRRRLVTRLIPGAVTIAGPPGADASPLMAGRGLVDGSPAAYVCLNSTCMSPVTDPEALSAVIDEVSARPAAIDSIG